MTNLIDIESRRCQKLIEKAAENPELEGLAGMTSYQVNLCMNLFAAATQTEVRIGLGLVNDDVMEELGYNPDDPKTMIYDIIDEIYEEAASGCFFCSKLVDPNERFTMATVKLCPMCKLKLKRLIAGKNSEKS